MYRSRVWLNWHSVVSTEKARSSTPQKTKHMERQNDAPMKKKNENIYIQTMISCIQGEFCRDVNVLFPCLFYAFSLYDFPLFLNGGLWKVLPVDSPDPTKRDSSDVVSACGSKAYTIL